MDFEVIRAGGLCGDWRATRLVFKVLAGSPLALFPVVVDHVCNRPHHKDRFLSGSLMKRLFLILFFVFFSADAFAAKKFVVSMQYTAVELSEITCEEVQNKLFSSSAKKPECVGFAEAVEKASNSPSYSPFQMTGSPCWQNVCNLDVRVESGICKAGQSAGDPMVPVYYSVNGVKVQTIRTASQVTGSLGGCKVRGVSFDTSLCVGYVRGNATLMNCNVLLEETGEPGGADGISDDDPGYNGSTTPETGGGTTPGGGTGGGDTGEGTTPGGGTGGSGGGTTPGGGTGGGDGTTPGGGTGGGGGTTPGGGTGGGDGTTPGGSTGGGSGGSGEANCGASGQPGCKIDETGTPSGKGLWNDLLDLLTRSGAQRQTGIDDAVSDSGKNTSPGLFSLPTLPSSCVDPSVEIVGRNFSIPICEYIPMIGAGFEAFWFIAFALACMSMVSRAMNKPVS